MKIFSSIQQGVDKNGMPAPLFVMHLDTEKTGHPDTDSFYVAFPEDFILSKNSEDLIEVLTSMITSLVYNAYGIAPETMKKDAITDWHATGFDRNYPNGVNTGSREK